MAHLPAQGVVARAEVAGPGFVNLWIDPTWFAAQVDGILDAGAAYANLELGAGQTLQVEFVSANPTGPLTVGHARGAVLGDTLARLMEAAGYEVTREYYFNNAGLQMEALGESLRIRYLALLGESTEGLTIGRHYEGDYIQWIAAALLALHGGAWRDKAISEFKDLAVDAIFAHIRHTLNRLDIQFDIFFNEDSLYGSGEVEAVLAELKARDMLYFDEGAWWFKATAFGKEKDRVFVRSNGVPTYRVPDIAYHRNKLQRFDRVVDIFGADHKDAYPDVLDALTALGEDGSSVDVLIHQFTTLVRDGEEVKMSTRRASFITLDELLDEVGPDAVRYFILSYAPGSHNTFDIDQAKSQNERENPSLYVQYAHARCCGILDREAPKRGVVYDADADLSPLRHEAERALIREMLRLREMIARVAESSEPHHIAYYARDLAAAFNNFYDKCPVLRDDLPNELRQARLKLTAAARIALARTLDLMGMVAPDEIAAPAPEGEEDPQ